MNWCKALCVLSIAIYGSACLAQDITDVEAKPYGSYTGGAIDTVDLATGNLMLNIPLISFPQLGKLQPLSFSVELNNAPYSQTGNAACDSGTFDGNGYQIECEVLSSRYDTSPPGAVYQYGMISNETQPDIITITDQNTCEAIYNTSEPCSIDDEWFYEDADSEGPITNMGAYLTSSFEGGIVTGQVNCEGDVVTACDNVAPNGGGSGGGINFSMVDPSGTTHEMESDSSYWNIYRAPDGSGYSFIPSGTPNSTPSGTLNAYDPSVPENGLGKLETDQSQFWLENASDLDSGTVSGVRLGTLYSPTGIQYTDTVNTFTPGSAQAPGIATAFPSYTPQALTSTEIDPSGNKITRGPWYWSGYMSYPKTPLSDIQTIYDTNPPQFVDSVGRIIPDIITIQATQYNWNWMYDGEPTSEPTIAWTVPGPENNPITYTITYTDISNNPSWQPQNGSNPPPDPSIDVAVQGWAISSIALPNGTEWTFRYAGATGSGYSAGDLEEVTTPSDGTITYTYTTIPDVLPIMNTRCNSVCHAVASRTETDGLNNLTPVPPGSHSWTTTYSYGVLSSLNNCPTVYAGGVQVLYAFTTTETDPSGNDTVHSFCAQPNSAGGVSFANQYHEILTQYYQGTGSNRTLLKSVRTASESEMDIAPQYTGGTSAGLINYLPKMIVTTTPAGSTTDTMQYSYDNGTALFMAARISCSMDYSPGTCSIPTNEQTIPISYLSPTTETASDGGGNVLRTTSTQFEFQNPTTGYMNANLIALPLSEKVWAPVLGQNVLLGSTSYEYDEAKYSPSGTFGNQTSKTETYYLSGSSPGETTITTHTGYNSQGMTTAKIDGIGNTTTITYDPATNYLFPSIIQRPTTINGVTHIDHYSYDSDTGNLNLHMDENGQTTSYQYDEMGRVTSISYPDGGGSTICYTDAGGTGGSCPEAVPFSLYTSTTTGPGAAPITTGHSYDGWGRQYRSTVLSDPLGPTYIDTTYDWEGKVTSVSNPYRSTPAPNDPPNGTTSYTYDALGRKTIQTQPDNSKQQWCYNGINTGQSNCAGLEQPRGEVYPVSWTDISDETGRHTQQQFDALGNLVAVMEPDPTTGHLAMETDYAYDVFDDLFTVNQYGASGSTPVLQREFYYDIPSRVTMACNPEALGPGQNCNQSTGTWYSYDADSNLKSKTDNRGITTSYAYDALNRLLSKTYQYDPSGTASSCYQYDGATTQNLSGRLVAQWTQKAACQGNPPALPSSGILTKTAISSYDAMGRLLSEQRCMGVANCTSGGYAMSYTYDLTGKLLTYPSGFGNLNFTNGYDATGRLSSVSQGSNSPLFWAPSYTPAGALSGAQLGASISMSRTFDSRQRVTSEADSTTTQ